MNEQLLDAVPRTSWIQMPMCKAIRKSPVVREGVGDELRLVNLGDWQ